VGTPFNLTIMSVSSAFGNSSIIPLGAAATVNGVTYLSFANAGATGGIVVDYSILDTNASEIGTATYTSSNATLTGRTPTKSTNGNAAIVASSAALILGTVRAETLGTVQSVATSIGLTGGPINTTGTLAVSLTNTTNTLAGNVAISSAGTLADGPTITQGTSGVWFASGGMVVSSTAAIGTNFYARLWDGTTFLDSANLVTGGANQRITFSLSGLITNPSSNIKMSVLNPDGNPGTIEFNRTGSSKDSTLTAFRIG